MERIIKSFAQTDLGCKRDNNEDNYIQRADKPTLLLLGAIDGVGGYAGGEVAAEICKQIVEVGYPRLEQTPSVEAELKALAIEANNHICTRQEAEPDLRKMSCVATFALLDSEQELLYYAHVGDSRGYILRGDELIKFTHDHSAVGYMEETGVLSEEEAMKHFRRNEISKLLGESPLSMDSNYVETGNHSFYARDMVLFCSDGLTDLVKAEEIKSILQSELSLEEKAQALIDKAKSYGGKDNITVALAYYEAEHSSSFGSAKMISGGIKNSDAKCPAHKQSQALFYLVPSLVMSCIVLGLVYLYKPFGQRDTGQDVPEITTPSDSTDKLVREAKQKRIDPIKQTKTDSTYRTNIYEELTRHRDSLQIQIDSLNKLLQQLEQQH